MIKLTIDLIINDEEVPKYYDEALQYVVNLANEGKIKITKNIRELSSNRDFRYCFQADIIK